MKIRHIFSQLTFSVSVECTFDFVQISHSCAKPFFLNPIYLRQYRTRMRAHYTQTQAQSHHYIHFIWKNLPPSLSICWSRKTHKTCDSLFVSSSRSLIPFKSGNPYIHPHTNTIAAHRTMIFYFVSFVSYFELICTRKKREKHSSVSTPACCVFRWPHNNEWLCTIWQLTCAQVTSSSSSSCRYTHTQTHIRSDLCSVTYRNVGKGDRSATKFAAKIKWISVIHFSFH